MVAEACKTKMAFRVRGSELSLDALKLKRISVLTAAKQARMADCSIDSSSNPYIFSSTCGSFVGAVPSFRDRFGFSAIAF